MKLHKRLALVLLGCCVSFGSLAAEVADLYQAQVPVASYNEADRARAIEQAFLQVLRRISAPGEASKQMLSQVSSQAATLLQDYQYKKSDDELDLQASFPPAATQQLLRQYRVPLWGAQRPRILLWTAYRDQANQRQLLSDMDDNALHHALERASAVRGVPIAFPLMDLTDSQQVFFSDVSGQFVSVLGEASVRYQPDGIAALHIFQDRGQWQGEWALQENDALSRGEVKAESPEGVATALIDALADHLAKQYAILLGDGEASQLLTLSELSTLQHLVQARRTLESLAMINRAELVQLDGNQATWSLQVMGELADVQRALAFDRHFRLTNDQDQSEQLILNYQWNP